MNKIFRRKLTKRWAVMACGFVFGGLTLGLILGSCSDNGVVINDSTEDYVSFFDMPYYPDAVAKNSAIAEASFTHVEARLSAEQGGVIALGDSAENEAFVVVGESIVADTTFKITVTRILTIDGEMPIIWDFSPDGLQFSRPAILRLDLGALFGKNVKAVDLYYLNEETNLWEYLQSCEADDAQIACLPIYHFSTYSAKSKVGTEPATNAR